MNKNVSKNGTTDKQTVDVKSVEANEATEAYDQMNADLRDATDRILGFLTDISKSGIERTWKLGGFVRKIRDDEDKYGENAMNLLDKVVGDYNKSTLRKAVNLNTWVSRDQLDRMIGMRMKLSNKPLAWAHVEKLLTVKNIDERNNLLDETVANDWTPEELQTATLKARNKTKKNAGGRNVEVPPTFTGRCEHYLKRYATIKRDTDAIYNHDEHGFLNLAENCPIDMLSPDKIDYLNRMIDVTTEAGDVCRQMLIVLEDARDILQKKMDSQAKSKASADADAVISASPGKSGKGKKLLSTK